MAKTFATQKPKLVGAFGCANNAPVLYEFPEAASQTFVAGDLVYLASGKVTVQTYAANFILGFAVNAATGTTDAACLVNCILPNQIWEMTMLEASNAAHTYAVADIGTEYEIQGSSGTWAVNQGGTTDTRVLPFKVSGGAAVGDISVPVLVRFAPQFLQLAGSLETT